MNNYWNEELIKKQIRSLKGNMLMKHMKHLNYLEEQLDLSILESLITEELTPYELSSDFKEQLKEDITSIYRINTFLPEIEEFSRLNRFIDLYNIEDIVYRDYSLDDMYSIMNEVFKVDKNYEKIFNNIYKENKNNLKFSEERNYTVYFNSLKYGYINIKKNNSMEEIFDITHEYSHMVSDSIKYHRYTDEYPFIEILPSFMFFITRDELAKDKKNRDDLIAIEATEFETNNTYAKEIYKEFLYFSSIEEIKRRRDIIKYIAKKFNQKKSYIIDLLSMSTLEKLSYVIPYMTAIELYSEYKIDKEKALYKLNKIIKFDDNMEDYLQELKSIGVRLNETSEQYVKQLNKKLCKKKSTL